MSELVDHLADLTGFRDRELLDVTLVGVLRDLLRPRSVAIYRSIGEAGNERWLTRARMGADDLAATTDPGWVETDLLPMRLPDDARNEAFEHQRVVKEHGSVHRSVFPVSTDREAIGVLEIESGAALDQRDERTVMSILRIYRNFQGLLDSSERDTLTGLLNRKTFDDSVLKIVADIDAGRLGGVDRRRDAPGVCSHWLGVIDIDHFKRVNDACGHLIGDEVLLLLSRLMRASFRFNDRLYRFGGEEFVVRMRGVGADAAARAFERLRAHVEQYAFPQVGRITVSVGFTELRSGDTPSGAFDRADRAVYHAKANGRNQVHDHAELVRSGRLEGHAKVGAVELF
jgi:diguanylate cyclase (GGDEF)-like protein